MKIRFPKGVYLTDISCLLPRLFTFPCSTPVKIMFFLIGLGLCDAKDITVRGLETIQKCDRVFLESYTSILTVNKDELVIVAQ